MRISHSILVALAAVLLVASDLDARADEPELDVQMRHNRLLRLTGAQISITAGQHLIATFVEQNGSTNVITVSFATGRSIPTRATVENIIRGAIGWPLPPRRGLENTWHLPKAEVIFSAPTNLVDGDFSGWFLSSLTIPKTNALERASTPAVSVPTNWPVLVNGTNVPKTFRFRPTKVEFHGRGTRRQTYTVVFKIEDPQVPADYFTDFCWDTEVDMFKALPTADNGFITVTAWTVTGPSPQQFRALPPFTLDGRVLQGLLHRSPPPPR